MRTLCVRPSSAVIMKKIKPHVSKFLKDGVRGRKAFFKMFSSPPIKHKTSQSRFFFGTRGAKKKLGKKKTPFFMGAAQTRKLLKKLDQNFHTLVRCEHTAFMNKKKQIFACENLPKLFIIHQRSDFIIHYSLNYFRTVEDSCPYRIGAVRT